MVGASYLELKREALASRIHLLPTRYDDSLASNAPEEHKQKFRCIQSLGSQLFDTYHPQPSMTSEPWQEARKAAAAYIYRGAEKCRRESRNESGWRTEIEHRIFQRFDIEVTCPKCSKRLWRSEIETEPAWSHDLLSLSHRQQRRGPCFCNPTSRRLDFDDVGTRDIFTTRVEEFVPSERAVPDSGKPIKLKPDRIVGLNCTSKFEKVLDSPYVHGDGQERKSVRDVVRATINSDNGGSPLLFPFLVLEAKAEKGIDGFEHMEVQSALPVMEALKIQYQLMTTTGNTVDIPGGPLVWFFANRGEDWRVYAGYVVVVDGLPYYYVVCLWGGCLTDRNGALQILLITDCIVDWARDTFRPNILLQLKMLGAPDFDNLTSYLDDEDIYTQRDATDKWVHDRNVERLNEEDQGSNYWDQIPNEVKQDNIQDLDKFVTADGLVRDARRIESHLLGIVITEANFPIFMASFDTQADARQSSRAILKILSQRYLVLSSQKALHEIETMWTGHMRCAYDEEIDEAERVFVQIRVSYFIDLDWHQVRQLNYLAVTAKALPLLHTCAEIRKPSERPTFGSASPPRVTEARLRDEIQTLLERTVRRDFHGATHRLSHSLHEAETIFTVIDDHEFVRTIPGQRVQIQVDTHEESPGLLLEGLVHSTHERFRIGRLFLDQPFLTCSSRIDFDTRILWKDYHDGDKPPAHKPDLGARLAFGPCPKTHPHQTPCEQNVCIYIMDGTNHTLGSMVAVMDTLPTEDIYITRRKDRRSSPAARERLDCGIENFAHFNFMKTLDMPNGGVIPANILASWRKELSERAERRRVDKLG